jgi:hypothetical protein
VVDTVESWYAIMIQIIIRKNVTLAMPMIMAILRLMRRPKALIARSRAMLPI